jgi:hypothetical protein
MTPREQRFPILHDIAGIPRTKRHIHSVVMHHTAGHPMDTAEDIDTIHRNRLRPFRMIGYHFVVLRNGLIQIGRPVTKIPASVSGQNTGTIAFVMCGNFSEEPIPTRLDPQARAAGLLAAELISWYEDPTLALHREMAATECPGKNFKRETIDNYVGFVLKHYEEWRAWYLEHVRAFDLLHPDFVYTGEL